MADTDPKPEIKTEEVDVKPPKMIKIKTEDDEIFQVDEAAAKVSQLSFRFMRFSKNDIQTPVYFLHFCSNLR